MNIKKKTWPEEFRALMDGSKAFDCRLDDFECNIGDLIIFEEFDPATGEYSGRSLEKRITYIAKTKEMKFWKEADAADSGLQIMSLQ